MATIISIEDFMTSKHEHGAIFDAMETAEQYRAHAVRLAEVLLWHAEHTPLEAWAAAAAGGQFPWPAKMLHTLFDNRPKRQATPAELAEIIRLLKAEMGHAPDYLVQQLSTDPDWHLFELPKPADDYI